jgi:hypothetical protein
MPTVPTILTGAPHTDASSVQGSSEAVIHANVTGYDLASGCIYRLSSASKFGFIPVIALTLPVY